MAEKRRDFHIGLGIGGFFLILVLALNVQETDSWLRLVCDGLFVGGTMVLGAGGLMFARNKGAFDMLGYGVSSVFHLHLPGHGNRLRDDGEDYFTYTQRKAKERKSAAGLLWAGALYMALAAISLVIYYLV